MAKSQKKSGREARKTKAADGKTKSKLPRYLADEQPTHVQIPTGQAGAGKPAAKG